MKNHFNFFSKTVEGQFDLDGQGLGHQFLNSLEMCMSILSKQSSSLKDKFKLVQKLPRPQGIT